MLFYDALHGGESNAGAFASKLFAPFQRLHQDHEFGISYRIRRHCLAYELVSVYNPLAVFRIARQAPIRKTGDEQQQGRSRRYATDELALESQKCTQTFLC